MKQFWLRYKLLLYLLPLLHNTLVGQNQMQNLIYEKDFKIIDSIKYEVLYEVEIVENILKPLEKLVDLQVLQIGTKTSNYFSKILFKNDSANTILEAQGADYYLSIPKSAAVYEVIADKKSKALFVTYRSDDIVFRYFEDIPKLNWIIHSEKKIIQQYTCQRATTNFRGRNYEAWFAPEIPIREGPYKFGGLPGLILKIEDSQKHYIYSCVSITKIGSAKPMRIRNWKYTETTRSKLNEFLERKYKNPVNYYNLRGVTTMIKKDGQFIEAPSDFSLPYNPIELK